LETAEIKAIASHFREMLAGAGKDEKNLNDIMGEWYECKIIGQKLPLPVVLDKVVSMSDRFPLPRKFLNIADINSFI
jgi:hypothetical protein